MSAYKRWSLTLNFAVFVIGIWVAHIYYGQWNTMEDAMKAERRAWVLVDQLPMKGSDSNIVNSEIIHLVVRVKNFGGGPATDVAAVFRLRCLRAGKPCPDPMSIISNNPSRGTMGPGQAFTLQRDRIWEGGPPGFAMDGDCVAYKDLLDLPPTHILFAYGRINYRDQFGQPHCALSCARYVALQDVWDFAGEHNEPDACP